MRRENSILEFAVLVAPERNAAGGEGRADRRAERRPVLPRDAADRHRPVIAVQVAREIEIGFELAKIGQHVVPAPAASAEVAPLIIVARQAAVGRLDVDAGAAPDHAALLVGARNRQPILATPSRCSEAGPDIAIAEKQRHRIAVEDFGGLRARRQVSAHLDQ